MRVVSFKICPFVQRVTGALEAKGLPYSIEYISLNDKPKWFRDISPTGQVPVIVTETGVPLFESDAIIEYLDDFYGPLVPGLTAEQKAIERAWSYQASKHYLVQCGTMRSSDKVTLKTKTENLQKAFARAELQLSGETPFFGGATLGKVDIAWLPLLHRAAIVEKHSGLDFLDKFPKVKAWQIELLKTGIAEKSVSDDFESVFTGFYLDPSRTYLGQLKQAKNTGAGVSAAGMFASSGGSGSDSKDPTDGDLDVTAASVGAP